MYKVTDQLARTKSLTYNMTPWNRWTDAGESSVAGGDDTRALRPWPPGPRRATGETGSRTAEGDTMQTSRLSLTGGLLVALLVGASGVAVAQEEEGEPSRAASEPWDLVWFSDSTGFFVADLWAEKIKEELGVEVRVHDFAKGSLQAVEILESLNEPTEGRKRLGDTRDDVAEAEIVVVYGNPDGSAMTSDVGEACVTTSTEPRDPPTRYGEADIGPYRDILDGIWERVVDLAGDRPVIVRAIDSYMPVIADWRLAGVEAECTEAWEAYSNTIQAAAAAFGIPTVSMYDAFNGADHAEDPRQKGYIISDGEHTSPAGRDAMVAALHEAGYEPLHP